MVTTFQNSVGLNGCRFYSEWVMGWCDPWTERSHTGSRRVRGSSTTLWQMVPKSLTSQEAVERKTCLSALLQRYFGRILKRTETVKAYHLRFPADCFVGTEYDAVMLQCTLVSSLGNLLPVVTGGHAGHWKTPTVLLDIHNVGIPS